METPKTPKSRKKNTGPKRKYQGGDAVMLTASLVILSAAAEAEIQPTLQARRSRLTPKALDALKQEVTDALEHDLGLNPTTIVQQLTQGVLQSQDLAQKAISQFNTDLKGAFPGQPKAPRLQELRATLGLRDHLTAVQGNQQQALSELLAKFVQATNDATLRAELENDLDISAAVIDAVRAQAGFAQLDAAQELGKGKAPVVTAATIAKFNDLYARVQAVASLARSVHQEQPATADRFSFSAVRRKMTGGAAAPAAA